MEEERSFSNSVSEEIILGLLDVEAVFLPDDDEKEIIDSKNQKGIESKFSNHDIIGDIAKYIAIKYQTDTGELAHLMRDIDDLVMQILGQGSTKCTRRRVSDLIGAWRDVITAAQSGDAEKIVPAAHHFRKQALGRSKMYNRCYKHIRTRFRQLADVADSAIRIYLLSV